MGPTALREPCDLSPEDRRTLLELVHRAVVLGTSAASPPTVSLQEVSNALREERAAFVSVYVDNQLRGCTGELTARRSLVECVLHHACSAAFRDGRFPPIQARDLDRLAIQISVLGRPIPIAFDDEQDLLRRLEPGIDGLTIEALGRQATFLPQVWESLPDPRRFLDHLKHKAGLPLSPVPGLQAWRYRAEVFAEPGLEAS